MSVASQVLFHTRLNPDRPALAFAGGVATYDMLGKGVAAASKQIERHVFPEAGIVAIDVRNPFHHIALILALELCGLTSVSLHTRRTLEDAKLDVAALLTDGPDVGLPGSRSIKVDASWFAPAASSDHPPWKGLATGQFYRVLLSSGTTGRPKPVGYTLELVERLLLRQALLRGEGGPRNLSMLGLSTIGFLSPIFALMQGGLACFAASPQEALWIIRVFEVSRLYMATAHLEALVAAARGTADPLPSLKAINIGGSKVPPGLALEARARLCGNILVSYGTTETGLLSYGRLGTKDGVEGSAGLILPWVEIEAMDVEGRPLPRGEEGRLRIKSRDMAQYVDPDDRRRQVDDAEWFYTDDIGYLRDDGVLVIKGRSSEVLNRGGVIVAPDYIETCIETHPAVREAAAFARAGRGGLDQIWVAVVPNGPIDPKEVLLFCSNLLGDKTPDGIELLDALPRTETGKVKRNELRDRFARPTNG